VGVAANRGATATSDFTDLGERDRRLQLHSPAAFLRGRGVADGGLLRSLPRLALPGGISNFVPATTVAFGVGLPILSNSPAAMQAGQSPIDRLQSGLGNLRLSADVLTHQTEDAY